MRAEPYNPLITYFQVKKRMSRNMVITLKPFKTATGANHRQVITYNLITPRNFSAMKYPDIDTLKATFPEEVSFFSGVKDIQAKHINLGRYLLATIAPRGRKEREAAQIVEQIRQTGDKSQKKQLPGITPSALIAEGEGRKMTDFINDDNLQAVTDWFQFDIDLAENKHLQNNPNLTAERIRDRLASESPYVAYCGLSCSGHGIWGLIKLEDSANHSEHFLALIEDFQQANIQLDTSKGGNLNDFRFYSYDTEAHINPNYRIYRKRKKPEPETVPELVSIAGTPKGSRAELEGTTVDGGEIILANGNASQLKHCCPQCGHRRFVRFVDIQTREYLSIAYGRCDREENCRYYWHPAWDKKKPSKLNNDNDTKRAI